MSAKTTQCQRDHAKLERDKEACPDFSVMKQCLHDYKMEWLLDDAIHYAARTGSDPPGRLARRHRDGLIVWYCEHRSEILRGVPFELSDMDKSKRRMRKDQQPPNGIATLEKDDDICSLDDSDWMSYA
jgi:hypothetical protein